jgi:hypothetical protein
MPEAMKKAELSQIAENGAVSASFSPAVSVTSRQVCHFGTMQNLDIRIH